MLERKSMFYHFIHIKSPHLFFNSRYCHVKKDVCYQVRSPVAWRLQKDVTQWRSRAKTRQIFMSLWHFSAYLTRNLNFIVDWFTILRIIIFHFIFHFKHLGIWKYKGHSISWYLMLWHHAFSMIRGTASKFTIYEENMLVFHLLGRESIGPSPSLRQYVLQLMICCYQMLIFNIILNTYTYTPTCAS